MQYGILVPFVGIIPFTDLDRCESALRAIAPDHPETILVERSGDLEVWRDA